MADTLDAMADALHFASSINGNTQRPSSPAAWENTGGSRLKGEWSSNPVLDANLSAGLVASSANDHASGLAAVLRMPAGGIFSTYTVARGLMETAARAWYLMEPDIDVLERVRRHMNERLYSLNESRLLFHGQGLVATHQDDEEKKILDTGKEHFTFRTKKNYKAARLGEERPSAMKLADDCMAAAAGEKGMGKMIYQLLSGKAHGVAYALLQLLGDPSNPHDPETPGVTLRQVQHNAVDVAQKLLVPVVVYASMSQRYFQRQGWDPAGWQEAARKTYRAWAALAQAVPDSDGLVTVPWAQTT